MDNIDTIEQALCNKIIYVNAPPREQLIAEIDERFDGNKALFSRINTINEDGDTELLVVEIRKDNNNQYYLFDERVE